MSKKRKYSNNYQKSGYNKSNQYESGRDKYFYTNSMNTDVDGTLGMYYKVGNETQILTIKQVLDILKGSNTKGKQEMVNRLSDYFYNSNGIYSSMIEKCVGLMTFDRVITQGKTKLTKDKYIEALRTINEKFVGRNAFRSCLKYGCYFGYLSYLEKNDNADGTNNTLSDDEIQLVQFSDMSVIPLNPKYVEILATDGKTFRIGLDLSKLNKTDMEGFPKDIYEAVVKAKMKYDSDVKRKKKQNIKIISKQYYILDEKKTIVIRLRANADEAGGRAAFVTAIMDLIHDNNLLNRKDDMLGKVAKTFIYETYPEGNKGKGTSALTQAQMEKQHNAIAAALRGFSNKEIGFCSIYPNTKIDSIDMSGTLSNLSSDDIIKRIGTNAGFSTGLLNGMDIKNDKVIPLIYEILAAEYSDFTEQWEKELNKVIANCVKKYKSVMDLPYICYLPTNRLNRDTYAEMYRRAFSDAGGSYQLYLASTGIHAEIHLALMSEEEKEGYREKYPAHPMASTSSFRTDGSNSQDGKENDEDNEENEEKDEKLKADDVKKDAKEDKTKAKSKSKNKKVKEGENNG